MGRLFPFGRLVALAMAVAMVTGAQAQPNKASTEPDVAKPAKAKRVKAALVCEQDAVVPGTTVSVGITLTLEPKWHVYWNGRNENGLPPSADFKLPPGFTVGPIQWPAPVRHIEPGDLLNHVYFNSVTLIVPLHVPATAKPDTTAEIKAHLSWMACEEACVGEQADVTLRLPIVAKGELVPNPTAAKAFEAARARLPQELPKDGREVQIIWKKDVVVVSALAASHLTFYPYEDCVAFADAIKDADAEGGALAIHLGEADKDHPDLFGVLEIRRGKSAPVFYTIRSSSKAKPSDEKPLSPPEFPGVPSRPSTEPKPYR